jgi:tetratricopeptide (TPR) repeat protein
MIALHSRLGALVPAIIIAACAEMPDRMRARAPSDPGPAPQSVSAMTPGLARIALRDKLQKRHLFQRATVKPDLLEDGTPGTSYYETKNLRIAAGVMTFDYDEDAMVFEGVYTVIAVPRRQNHHVVVRFASEGYCTGVHEAADSRARFFAPSGFDPQREGLYAWQDPRDAGLFCDAWNQLVQQAHRGDADDMRVFSANARSWRERPATRPPQPPALERERILAENSYRERDFFAALEHFEAGLKLFPAWEQGWFNAALLYEALGEYEYASSRMRHYLELAPNAPDAADARAKLIVWHEKMRRQ